MGREKADREICVSVVACECEGAQTFDIHFPLVGGVKMKKKITEILRLFSKFNTSSLNDSDMRILVKLLRELADDLERVLDATNRVRF